MITAGGVERLRGRHTDRPAVVSLYLSVPVDVADHRGLPARARELIKAAAKREPRAAGRLVSDADAESIINAVDQRRPHIRPLLAALQRHPAYRAALVDTKHAWILHISDDRIETVAERTGAGVRSPAFAGWYGLEAYRVQQRIIELSKQHFRDTIGILEQHDDGTGWPLVLGGHDKEISQFLGLLPRTVRQSFAGSFTVDLQTATPGRVRELARPVIADWTERSEARVVEDTLDQPPYGTVRTDLRGCLAASRARAIAKLVLPDDALEPGFACSACGALSTRAADCDCTDPGDCCHPVPDLLDELANRTLDSGGEVISVRSAPFTAAAKLRFPVSSGR